ncbi:TetR/AcrR family transcriptional regulator [soil metagenome]
MASAGSTVLSTAEARRETVIAAAVTGFSRHGYLGTPIAAVAQLANISPAYVFKLFPGKESLFVAALDRCYSLIETALTEGADAAADQSPDGVLYAMGGAYADLIVDKELLMLQVHAQAATDVPEIAAAVRRGLERITNLARRRSGAADAEVQRFIAFGQLCHLTVTTGLDASSGEWARVLLNGIRHRTPNGG